MPGEAPSFEKAQRSLPTLDKLRAELPERVDALDVARKWLQEFDSRVKSDDVGKVVELFLPNAFWRDNLSLTWEFRTFEGARPIHTFLEDRLRVSNFGNLKLNETYASFERPYPDLAWVQAIFDFETEVGVGKGVFRIVPTASGDWKAYTVYTAPEELKAFPEQLGPRRKSTATHGMWPELRRQEIEFENSEPTVLIVGAGQSGLDVAARLKLIGVSVLNIEKNARVGDQWRGRYDFLCLHDPIWLDHMPYIPFPASWPLYIPAPKLADWLEFYAQSMEINVWLSSHIHKIDQGPNGEGWVVKVTRGNGVTRELKPKHIVFAHGGKPKVPQYPGQDEFKGKIMHSSQYRSAKEHIGKKVVVVGACSSGHDISQDHCTHGVDVTMYQRTGTHVMSKKEGLTRLFEGLYVDDALPVEIADLFWNGCPNNFLRLLHQRVTKDIAEADKDLLDGLVKAGFKLDFGKDGSGPMLKAYEKGGGFYIDSGASGLIAEGKIKLKSGSSISHFTDDSIIFEDGSSLPADVVIFATGYADRKQLAIELCGEEVGNRINPIWGLDEEGEFKSVWRWSGVPNLHFMAGNLAQCRSFSKHLALYIKAIEEGLIDDRYSKKI